MKASNHSNSEPTLEGLPGGAELSVRPIRAQDVELERQFITGLSPESRRSRFLDTMTAPSESLLRRLTTIDPSRDAALAAVDPHTGRFVGVARFSVEQEGIAEMAVAVSDTWQHRGVGTLLARSLIAIARSRGLRQLYSVDLSDNHGMERLGHKLGFHHHVDPDDATQLIYTLDLAGTC
jgi:N-acetylglutamate synthase-like GNAT family acetyltransferase